MKALALSVICALLTACGGGSDLEDTPPSTDMRIPTVPYQEWAR